METHITQLRAALSKNCPSSNNVVFQSRLLKAEDELRKLSQLHANVRLRAAKALSDQNRQYESLSTSPSPAMASGEELHTAILAEVTAAKEAAQEDTTDPEAYNILHNSSPEVVKDNFITLYTEYSSLTLLYGGLTDNVN